MCANATFLHGHVLQSLGLLRIHALGLNYVSFSNSEVAPRWTLVILSSSGGLTVGTLGGSSSNYSRNLIKWLKGHHTCSKKNKGRDLLNLKEPSPQGLSVSGY